MRNLNELPVVTSREDNNLQCVEQEKCIVVGITNPRTRLRVETLLRKMSGFYVKHITSGSDVGRLIEEADLIIGTRITAYEGVLRQKPVIVVGDYGLGGLVTPDTFRKQYHNRFRGKINGMKDESFSLERLEEEIKRAFSLTFQELQMMSNQTITFLNI